MIEKIVRHKLGTGGHLSNELKICAWCNRKLGLSPGNPRHVSVANYGMCRNCLAERLAALTRRAAAA